MAWKPSGRRFDLAQLPHKLSMLKDGPKYKEDLSAGPMDHKLLPERTGLERNNEYSKALLLSLPLTARTKRDFAIDEQNPREELPKYVKTEDQIPPFDREAISSISKYDGQARQQIQLTIAGRQSYAVEENKYDSSFEKNDNELGQKVDSLGNPTASARRAEYQKAKDLERAEMQESTQSL